MNTIRRGHLVAAVAAVAVLGVAGTALAAGPPPNAPRLGQQVQAGQGYGIMAGGVVMDAAAEYLGLSETELATLRHGGKSLAQIAVDKGKTVAGLQAAVTAAFKANLDKAVAAGRLTSAQAAQVMTQFQANVQTQLNRTTTGPMNGRGPGRGAGAGLGLGPCGGVNR